MNTPTANRLARMIVEWYRVNARDLPWRRTRDPYAIWVSEIMLQQTQVKTVIPYFERWMSTLPNISALAAAPEAQILKLWEGLGYYSRVRNLRKAAQLLVAQNNSAFPSTFSRVLELPGIGRYTAGAICSIAFGETTPILDGNVARVLSRLFGIKGDVKSKPVCDKLWNLSAELVSAAAKSKAARRFNSCSALNQGLMELGATVCTPRNPNCGACPLRRHCYAFHNDLTGALPEMPARATMKHRRFFAFVLQSGDKVLIRQRPSDEVNGGFWEFPNFEWESGTEADRMAEFLGFRPQATQELPGVKHCIMNNRIDLRSYKILNPPKPKQLATRLNGCWLPPGELQNLPFASAHSKIRAHLQL